MWPLCNLRGQTQTKQFLAFKGNVPTPVGLLVDQDVSGASYSLKSKIDILLHRWRLSSKAA